MFVASRLSCISNWVTDRRMRNRWETPFSVRLSGASQDKCSYFLSLSFLDFVLLIPLSLPNRRHLAEALYSGCIPVLVVDDTQLPFDDILDYTKFSITIPEAHLPNLINILQNYDLEELTDLQVNGIKVRDFFLWRSEQPVGAAIDEGPLRLALVGTRMRVGGTTDGGPLQYRTGGGLFTTPQD